VRTRACSRSSSAANDVTARRTLSAGVDNVISRPSPWHSKTCHVERRRSITLLERKDDIRDMGVASQDLLKLRPVTFRYKLEHDDGPGLLQYGLIAEEVAEIYPELVVLDKEGQPSGVRYHVLPAMLLNELQRQQREIDELRAQVRAHRWEGGRQRVSDRSRLTTALVRSCPGGRASAPRHSGGKHANSLVPVPELHRPRSYRADDHLGSDTRRRIPDGRAPVGADTR
jgi:Chaperone of endosialidase